MDSTAIRIISYFDDIEEFLIGILFFSLPFGWAFSIIPIILFSTLLLFNAATKASRPSKEKVMYFLPMLVFYLWEGITLFYSSNKQDGLSTLGTQAIMAVTILGLLFNRIKPETIQKAFYLFLLGCISSLFILYGIAIYNSSSIVEDAFIFRPYFDELGPTIIDSDTKGHFFAGSQFSQFIHPAYLALLIGIAMLIILQGLKFSANLFTRKHLWLTFFTLFGISIITMSLNATVVMIMVISLYVLYYVATRTLHYGDISRLIYSSVLVFLLFFLLNPQVNILMKHKLDAPSIQVKQKLTEASQNVLKDHWLWGVGIGDIDHALEEEYQKQHDHALNMRCPNSHNQFMTTWLHGGLPALAALLWIFYTLAMRAYRKNSLLIHAISGLFILSFFFESMLIRYWGVITFTLFYGALYFYSETTFNPKVKARN